MHFCQDEMQAIYAAMPFLPLIVAWLRRAARWVCRF